MRWVIDTSALAAWLLPDEAPVIAQDFFQELELKTLLAPALIFYEIQNSLLSAERRGRISATTADQLLITFETLPLHIVSPIASTLLLARQHQLSIYDAAYLQVALEHGAALATLDRKLAAAAKAEGVAILI